MINKEGFWWSKHEPHLPKPLALEYKWHGRKAFLDALRNVEVKVRLSKLDGRASAYKGMSTCRICGERCGHQEYRLTFMDSTWEWPEGYIHYVKTHNVRPSYAFQEFIMAVDAAKTKMK